MFRLVPRMSRPTASNGRRSWYEIRAAGERRAEIRIYDEIGAWGISARDFVAELVALEADEILLRINSVGGDVFDGFAIYNALRDHPARIVARVDGVAASAASVIMLAGDRVEVHEAAFVMIHNPWGFAIGDAAELRAMAEALDKVTGPMVDIYSRKTGKPADEIRTLMNAETWYTGAEAVEAGLADDLLHDAGNSQEPAPAASAAVDVSGFRNPPAAIAGDTQPTADPLELMRRRLYLQTLELE